MAQARHIIHSIPPTYDERSRVLVLGSMPSPASREAGFNYGHPRNRFWNVMAALAEEPAPDTTERRRDFCLRHHIALWDVLAECDIEGASDASIRNPKPNPLEQIRATAPIEAVFCTGAKAHELYTKLCEPSVGIPAVKLPSTSPANAAYTTQRLVEAYTQIFEHTHDVEPPTLEVPDVVALEQAIAADGTSLFELMNRAGTALAWRIEAVLDELSSQSYVRQEPNSDESAKPLSCPNPTSPLTVLLCGNGNNGGDGWVAAELLARAGRRVCLVSTKAAADISAQPAHDAALIATQTLESLDAILLDPDADQLNDVMDGAAVVVDCILGTGASGRSPKEPFATWIRAANDARGHAAIIAADVPSGVSAHDGQVVSPHVVADETVTMIVGKPGLIAPECGHVWVAPLAYTEPYLQ